MAEIVSRMEALAIPSKSEKRMKTIRKARVESYFHPSSIDWRDHRGIARIVHELGVTVKHTPLNASHDNLHERAPAFEKMLDNHAIALLNPTHSEHAYSPLESWREECEFETLAHLSCTTIRCPSTPISNTPMIYMHFPAISADNRGRPDEFYREDYIVSCSSRKERLDTLCQGDLALEQDWIKLRKGSAWVHPDASYLQETSLETSQKEFVKLHRTEFWFEMCNSNYTRLIIDREPKGKERSLIPTFASISYFNPGSNRRIFDTKTEILVQTSAEATIKKLEEVQERSAKKNAIKAQRRYYNKQKTIEIRSGYY